MEQIGKIYLINRGAFNADPEVCYIDSSKKQGKTDGYGKKMAGQSITFDPGSKPEIVDGETIWLHVNVQAGIDKTAKEHFQYKSGETNTANYAISGITLHDSLKFLGVTSNVEDSEKLAAEFAASDV